MKRWALLTIAITVAAVSSSAFATRPELSRAAALAFKGELEDAKLIERLEVLAHSTDPKESLWAHYLLTLAPLRLLKHGIEPHENAVLAQEPFAKITLGEMAVVRTHRSRGDRLFNDGKFLPAAADYEPVQKSTDSRLAEYAYLKLGWCYLNSKAPARALEIWFRTPTEAQTENIWHGIGQAIVEKTDRRADDVDQVVRRLGDACTREGFYDGIVESIDSLSSSEVKTFADQWKATRCFEAARRHVLELAKFSGEKACDLVAWLTADEGKFSADQAAVYSTALERCVDFRTRQYAPAEKADAAAKPAKAKGAKAKAIAKAASPATRHAELTPLYALLDRFELHGVQRKPRLQLFRAEKRSADACREGMIWLAETTADDRLLVEPVLLAADCAAASTTASIGVWWPQFESVLMAATTDGRLRQEKDPVIFFLAKVIKQDTFRARMTDLLEAKAAAFDATLVPVLVAESWSEQKGGREKRASLLARFGAKPGDKQAVELWDAVRQEQIATWLEKKDFDQVLGALRVVAPDPATSGAYLSVWMAWLVGSTTAGKTNGLADAWTKLMHPTVLKAKPKVAETLLELTCDFQKWKAVETALAGVEPNVMRAWDLSDRFKGCFVTAFKAGLLDEKAWRRTGDPELKFLMDLTAQLRQPTPRWTDVKPVGRSPFAVDVALLKKLQSESSAYFTKSNRAKDPLTTLNRDVNYWSATQKKIQKHTWSSPELGAAAEGQLKWVCEQVREKVPKARASAAAQVEAAMVEQLFGPIEKNFSTCDRKGAEGKVSE